MHKPSNDTYQSHFSLGCERFEIEVASWEWKGKDMGKGPSHCPKGKSHEVFKRESGLDTLLQAPLKLREVNLDESLWSIFEGVLQWNWKAVNCLDLHTLGKIFFSVPPLAASW